MILVRSLLFNLLFYCWLTAVGLVCLPLLLGPRKLVMGIAELWAKGVMLMLRLIVGLDYELRGREHLPAAGPVVFAAKHQSAWDTIIFLLLVDDPAYVLKRELFQLPVYGWYCRKMKMIGVDRSAGASALKRLAEDAAQAFADGRPVVIFPQGTRTAPCIRHPYLPGTYLLAARSGAVTVPVALNSGLFWARRSFVRRPGRIVVELLPPLAADLPRKTYMTRLEEGIEAASDRLAGCASS